MSSDKEEKDFDSKYNVVEIIKNFLKKFLVFINRAAPLILLLFCLMLIFLFMLFNSLSRYTEENAGKCIEANEFGSSAKVIYARSTKGKKGYLEGGGASNKYERIIQKIALTDLGLKLNNDPITINIQGEWTPWRTDETIGEYRQEVNSERKPLSSLDESFFCLMEKKSLPSGYTFSNKPDENEFYYIKNYYSDVSVSKNTDNDKITVKGIAEVPERQKNCWVTRGMGLYLGAFGVNGKREPTAYHHLAASKMICNRGSWFNGKAKDNNYIITKYNLNNYTYNYTLRDFEENYFSLGYHIDKMTNDLSNSENKIFIVNNNQVIFNIELYENLLYKIDSKDYKNEYKNVSYIISNAMSAFYKACYNIEKANDGTDVRKYKSYFQFGPKILYKNYSSLQNVRYEYGEKIKMLIVDKYYDDNYGFYNIEIVSGINFDDSGSIVKKIQAMEFYLLGTPHPGDIEDRADGLIAKLFNNLLSSGFASFMRAALVLYVIMYGIRIIFGFKENKKVISQSDLMLKLFKLSVLVALTTPGSFAFFNKTILNFVINGTIGIIDLISGIFSNTFSNDNIIALTGGLQHANEVLSLSRNFAIIDEILSFFKTDTVVLKILSLFFNEGGAFFLGIIIGLAVVLILVFYVLKLMQAVVPFMFTLIQISLVLPLAPLFILFSFFGQTSYIFKNWINFIAAKCLELIAYFVGFYFVTFIINNFIKQLLNFKVCFYALGDYLFDTQLDSELKEWLGIPKLIKDILNKFLFFEKSEMPYNSGNAISYLSGGVLNNFFGYYLANISLTFILLMLFDMFTKEVMSILARIMVIDGSKASDLGGSSLLSNTGNFSLSNQAAEFSNTMGLAEVQRSSDALAWTKKFVDLEKGISGNFRQTASNLFKVANFIPNAIGDAVQSGFDDTGEDGGGKASFTTRLGRSLTKNFAKGLDSVTGDAFGKDSLIDLHARDFGEQNRFYNINEDGTFRNLKKFFNKSIARKHNKKAYGDDYKYYDKNDLEKRLKEIEDRKKTSDEIINNLLSLSDDDIKKKFNKEDAERLLKLKKILNDENIKLKDNLTKADLLEHYEINDYKLLKLKEFLDDEDNDDKNKSKDEEEAEAEAFELFTEDGTKLFDEDSKILIDENGDMLIDEDSTCIIDIVDNKLVTKINTKVN